MLFRVTHNVRGLAKYGNSSWSSPEQMLIEKLLMKITTKAKLLTSSPEPKHNRITNAEDNKVKPVFCQT
jgi:hypothetical protein